MKQWYKEVLAVVAFGLVLYGCAESNPNQDNQDRVVAKFGLVAVFIKFNIILICARQKVV